MVVNGGEEENLRKIIGKNYLWVGPIQEPQGFVIDMVVEENTSGKSLEKLLWGGSLQESQGLVLDMMVNGREQKDLRNIIDKKTTLGWFNIMITRLFCGYGGEWW